MVSDLVNLKKVQGGIILLNQINGNGWDHLKLS
jgi:hypothetical protein